MSARHLNPDQLIKNPAFTRVVSISGPVRAVYVDGQNAVSTANPDFLLQFEAVVAVPE
jgi:hypothetical protein